MRLRLKVLIILASVWVVISLMIYAYSASTLAKDYERLERNEVIANIDQASKTLNSMLSALKIFNNDWAQWDDAYHFMVNKDQKFILSNLTQTTFENAKINFILFFNTAGNLYYGLYYDLNRHQFTPIPQDITTYLESSNGRSFIQNANESSQPGFIKIGEHLLAVSALPILTSAGKGPSHGTLVMGYFFNKKHIQVLSDILKMHIHFFSLPIGQQNEALHPVYEHLRDGQPYYIFTPNKNTIEGYKFISSIDNKPIGILSIEMPRTLYREGITTIEHYIAIVITLGVLFLVIMWYLLKIFVLDRIINIGQQVIRISTESKFSDRIESTGKDEMGNMVVAINTLMEIIELSQEQLKYRIFQRTEELERLSKLNKNLYSEMKHQKAIESKLREDEKILRQMAYYDALTGLPNRIFFNEILQKMLAKSQRDGTGIVIMFLDADKLKSINDTYGHDVGDKLLIHTAQRLKNSIKESDFVARLAGDEFIICLSQIRGKSLINKVAEKILQNISIPLKLDNVEIQSTFSIGISIYPEDGATLDELEKRADLAMYYAKKQAGNAYCYYDEIKKKETTRIP